MNDEKERRTQLIERTSKDIKKKLAIGIIVGWTGALIGIVGAAEDSTAVGVIGVLIAVGGLSVGVYAKILQWWHHG